MKSDHQISMYIKCLPESSINNGTDFIIYFQFELLADASEKTHFQERNNQ